MLHLAIERLAELGVDEPTPLERTHLAECETCAAELQAYQQLVSLARDERRRIAPPLTEWGRLRVKLLAEGLIATTDVPAEPKATPRFISASVRVAAALALVAGGTIFGRFSAGLSVGEALALNDIRFGGPSAGSAMGVNGQEFASTAAAYEALQKAQIDYENASAFIAVHDTTSAEYGSEVLQKRLAALDRMAEISLAEVQERPQDPMMNQVLLTTVGAREVTLTKLGTALPAGARLTRW